MPIYQSIYRHKQIKIVRVNLNTNHYIPIPNEQFVSTYFFGLYLNHITAFCKLSSVKEHSLGDSSGVRGQE